MGTPSTVWRHCRWKSIPLVISLSVLAGTHARAEAGPFVLSVEGGKTKVLAFTDGTKTPTTLFEEAGLTFKTIVISADGEYLAIRDTPDSEILLYTLAKKSQQRLPGTVNGIPAFFVKGKPWLVFYREPPAKRPGSPHGSKSKVRKLAIEVIDFAKKRGLRPLVGSYAHPSVKDDSVYLLKQGGESAQIFRFIPGKKETPKVATVPLDGIEVTSINELHGVDHTQFIYQTTGEHEIRYYWGDGNPLFPGDPDKPKEQLDLALSQDGKLAAFTERNPNELSYLVTVDLSNPQAKAKPTQLFGSFPHIFNGRVYFLSDPAFIKAKDTDFRQIESYVLYAYDPTSGKVEEVHRFAGPAGLL